MFKKILIANRGEIACRVAATARRMGIHTVAVYSDADAHARHVQACDEAVHIGAAAPRDSYLRWERIIEAAQATGAQAVHPGYGFLSENAEFARACAKAGIIFIGPSPAAIAAMGSKAAAKTLMQKAGVPLVPGYHGEDNDPALLRQEADKIGYPVLIKAVCGGGGKGMRRVDRAEDFDAALAACRREAQASFGDERVLLERYVTQPRHIEIQIFGDARGHFVYLFERDCSVQRRHQKVLEEAPAPGLSEVRRAEMGAAAVAAAKAVGYVGAGTVEFIAEPNGSNDLRFYFMEMNTRLQVEHPVTEAITGYDLVEWQLRVAAGQALPVTQVQLRIHGHAIEARICAENPEAQFLPATGRLDVMRWPEHVSFQRAPAPPVALPAMGERRAGSGSGPLCRIDTGFGEGDTITPHYDSMIAKLIVWGENRAQALARLDEALAQTHIVGLHTNTAFLRRVVNSPAFATANLDTALIERERALLFGLPEFPLEMAVGGLVAHRLAVEQAGQGSDPWSRRDGWRLHGQAQRRLELEVGAARHTVMLTRERDGSRQLTLGGTAYRFHSEALAGNAVQLTLDGRRMRLHVYPQGDGVAVFGSAGHTTVRVVDVAAAQAEPHAGSGLAAPMPGKVVALLVQVGQAVRRGQPVAVMEAMKMEHTLTAAVDGIVAVVRYAVGDQVAEGALLVDIAGAAP